MYNGNVQQNPLCAASCFHLSPVLAYVFYRGANPAPYSAPFFSTLQPKLMHLLCTAVLIGSILKTLCSKLFMRRVVVVFFTLTDRASTIPSNIICGCQSSTYVVCWTEKDQRNIYQAPMGAKEKHKHTKNNKVWRSIIYTCTTGIFNRTLCVESCVTEEFHISPRTSPAFFHRDAMCCTSFVSIMH